MKRLKIEGQGEYDVDDVLAYFVLDLAQAYRSLSTRLRKKERVVVGSTIPKVELVVTRQERKKLARAKTHRTKLKKRKVKAKR